MTVDIYSCDFSFAAMIFSFFSGAASTARALSAYFDSLINFSMTTYFLKHFPLHSRIFAEYADLFAMSLCLLITSMLTKMKFFNEKQKSFVFSFVGYWY